MIVINIHNPISGAGMEGCEGGAEKDAKSLTTRGNYFLRRIIILATHLQQISQSGHYETGRKMIISEKTRNNIKAFRKSTLY